MRYARLVGGEKGVYVLYSDRAMTNVNYESALS